MYHITDKLNKNPGVELVAKFSKDSDGIKKEILILNRLQKCIQKIKEDPNSDKTYVDRIPKLYHYGSVNIPNDRTQYGIDGQQIVSSSTYEESQPSE